MTDATFTFRVEEQLKSAFAKAAKAQDRTGAQLLRDFMREIVRNQQIATEHDAWFREEVKAEVDAANAGDLIDADQVEAEAAVWRDATRRDSA